MDDTLKRFYFSLIATLLITTPESNFAQDSNGKTGGCPCALAEKPINTNAAQPSNHTEEHSEAGQEASCPAATATDEHACGLPENKQCPCAANHSNHQCKACDGENHKHCYIECDDIYCPCYPLSLSHTEGNWFDNRIGYTSIHFFWPFPLGLNNNGFSYTDVRAHVFNNWTTAGNIGGGFRFVNPCNCSSIFGVNAFYDFRKTTWNNYFQQIGIGFEILNSCFDFRFNGYLPIGTKTGRSRRTHHKFGKYFSHAIQQSRSCLGGFDAGIGKWIVKDACGTFDFYATLGIYSYFPKKHRHKIFGGEVRLLSNLIQYFSLDLRAKYDQVYGTQAQGKLAFYIPLGISPCECFENKYIYDDCYLRERLCQPLFRQEIIILDKRKHCRGHKVPLCRRHRRCH